MRPECESEPVVIVKLLPVIVSVASIACSSPCLSLPVYVPDRSVCSSFVLSQRPVLAAACLRCLGLGFVSGVVVDEFVFCADMARPTLANPAAATTATPRMKVQMLLLLTTSPPL